MPSKSRATVVSCCAGAIAGIALNVAMAGADGVHPCAAITDDPSRLACYDQAFGREPGVVIQREEPAITQPQDKFGFTAEQIENGATKEKNSTPEITASVAKLERKPTGEFIATLDNDQVWLQRERNTRARLKVGDPVTIRKAALGSFLLVTADGIATRVRRFK